MKALSYCKTYRSYVNTPNIRLGHKVLLPCIAVTEFHQSPTRLQSSFDTLTFGINTLQQTNGVWKANRLPIGYSCPVTFLLSWRKELSITCSEVTITLSVATLLTELHDTQLQYRRNGRRTNVIIYTECLSY